MKFLELATSEARSFRNLRIRYVLFAKVSRANSSENKNPPGKLKIHSKSWKSNWQRRSKRLFKRDRAICQTSSAGALISSKAREDSSRLSFHRSKQKQKRISTVPILCPLSQLPILTDPPLKLSVLFQKGKKERTQLFHTSIQRQLNRPCYKDIRIKHLDQRESKLDRLKELLQFRRYEPQTVRSCVDSMS